MIDVKFWLNFVEQEMEVRKLNPSERFNYKLMKQNYDPRIKDIGDQITIWDNSLMVDFDSGEFVNDEILKNLLFKRGIVVRINERYEIITHNVPDIDPLDRMFLDLIVFIPELNQTVRTHSDFVKLMF